MIPILYDNKKTIGELLTDRTNGVGRLSDCISCFITEERNGQYTAELEYPTTGSHFNDLKVDAVLKIKANIDDSLQLFRINKISKPMKGVVTIYANHISYDLKKTSVPPFESSGATVTLDRIKSLMVGGSDFIFFTDIANTTSVFRNKKPQSARALMGGQSGSLLDVFGGEYAWNNEQVKLLAHRGTDRGVSIEYGKNLIDAKQEENIESMYTAVMPYVLDDKQNAITGTLQTIVSVPEPRILNLDLSSKFSGSEPPTVEQINSAAQTYINTNHLDQPKISISLKFVDLSQMEEFKDVAPLLHLGLCDKVKVRFDQLGINATARVVKVVYDTLLERYDSLEIGDVRSSFERTITGIADETKKEIQDATGFLDSTITAFTQLVTNGLGLFITKVKKGAEGGEQIYLHNRPKLAESQYQWTINASGFAVSKDYGQTWSAGFSADGDAVFNSLSANAITALSIYGSIITFGDRNGINVVAQATPQNDGILFSGTGKIKFSSSGEFEERNLLSNGKLANKVRVTASVKPGIYLENYDYQGQEQPRNKIRLAMNNEGAFSYFENFNEENVLANDIRLINQGERNDLDLENYDGTTLINAVKLGRRQNFTKIEIINRIPGTELTANSLIMNATPDKSSLKLVNNDMQGNERCGLWLNEDGTFSLNSNTGGTSQMYTLPNGNMQIYSDNSLNIGSYHGDVVLFTSGVNLACKWEQVDGRWILTGHGW